MCVPQLATRRGGLWLTAFGHAPHRIVEVANAHANPRVVAEGIPRHLQALQPCASGGVHIALLDALHIIVQLIQTGALAQLRHGQHQRDAQ